MNQDEFEQTVMQELHESEEKQPEPLSQDWFDAFDILSKQLKEIEGDNKCQVK